jgi:hypothetical protein
MLPAARLTAQQCPICNTKNPHYGEHHGPQRAAERRAQRSTTMPIRALLTTCIISLSAALFLMSLPASPAAAGEACVGAPNRHADSGGHWYYRVDRVHHRRCWYQKSYATTPSRESSGGADASSDPGTRPAVVSWLSSMVSSVGGSNAVRTEEPVPATTGATSAQQPQEPPRRRAKPDVKRVAASKVAAQKVSAPISEAGRPANALPYDTGKREALFREFLEWRQKGAICSAIGLDSNSCYAER